MAHDTGVSLHLRKTTLHVRRGLWGSERQVVAVVPSCLPVSMCTEVTAFIKVSGKNTVDKVFTAQVCASISSVKIIQTANLDLPLGQEEL